ncbi:MAG: hypothetical protein WDW36_009145 [Sanguina aurantia]
MGISRDSLHKRRLTGGRKKHWRKAKKYELGRQSSMTKLSQNTAIRTVRVRGGNKKFRGLRMDTGNYSWGSEAMTRKVRVLDVVYNASNNELVRTQTLVKNAIVQVDANPFRLWYQTHYGVELGLKKAEDIKKAEEAALKPEEAKGSKHIKRKLKERLQTRTIDPALAEQFSTGRLFAAIASRPGQCGRCDGYILEGKELEFYQRKMQKKAKKN